MQIPSKLLEEAVDQLASLPGIGKKTALRLALHLLKRDAELVNTFSKAIIKMRTDIRHCSVCHNISDLPLCGICGNPSRNPSLVCVVEDVRDVMAIESTGQFKGVYHVLGGIISPINGIGPADLTLEELVNKVAHGGVTEVVLALNTTMEGDTTNFYIYKRLKPFNITISQLARGVAVGDDLQYADEITLGRSIVNRTLYESTFAR